MAFVDELKIFVKAGDGGDGVVRFRHEKNREFGGPSGGNGGSGGSVYVHAVRDVHLLSRYRNKKEFLAERGGDGGNDSLHGKNGEDLDIMLPVGSIITNLNTEEKISLSSEGERVLLLEGGDGGRGNESYKSSTNQAPKEHTTGRKAEEGEFFIEVELIADIGLIGLPNAGKTSLLNELTQAKGKIGGYPFTTLEPSLGECHGYIISDIPGLIEGASEGKGLGHKFLRHIRRTKMLVHLISLENKNPLEVYKQIRKELEQFDPELITKKEIIVLTKTDLIDDQDELQRIVKEIRDALGDVLTVTIYDDVSVKALQEFLLKEVSKNAV